MELKVLCECGQKFKFDVEPVNGQMPFKVQCPVCNADATDRANLAIAEKLAQSPPQVIAPLSGASRISDVPAIVLPGMATPVNDPPSTAQAAYPKQPAMSLKQTKISGEFNLGAGILGAILGAGLGAGLMYGFFLLANFRFPMMGTGIGLLTGLGARLLYKGKDSTLGAISAAIAVLATCGTLFLMYGELGGLFFVSIGVSGYFAYRIAA